MSAKRIVIFGYSGSIHIQKWTTSLSKRGFHILVISLDGDDIPGIEVVKFRRFGKLSYFRHASKAARTALEFKPDIIHVHYAGGYGIWGAKTKFHPLVVSVWGSDIESLPKSIFYRPFIKSALSQADQITATSESLKKTTISLLEKSQNKIEVVPFGVTVLESTSKFPTTDYVSAIYLKHLKTIYAPDILIKATATVVQKFSNFQLTICGDGILKDNLIQLVQDLELENNVHFQDILITVKFMI